MGSLARFAVLSVLSFGGLVEPALAQEAPAEATPLWQGKVGAGLALTSGNADTSNFNLGFELVRDPSTKNIIRADGLYLRGSNDGETIVNRSAFAFRDEYSYSERTFFFGQIDYLRDTFKSIDYLLAPTAGVGHKLYMTDVALLSVDGGVGVVWERNPGFELLTSGAVTAGERFDLQLSETSSVTQSVSALWKMNDFNDGLYTFRAGLVTAITARSQLSIEFLDSFKNAPPTPDIKKNDIAIVMAISYVF